jgi:phosphoribosylanthranilate isomerase
MTRVKICGITRFEDCELAIELGASALGFNFYQHSPRYISPGAAWEIVRRVPAPVMTVGVFADETDIEHVLSVAREAGVSAIELHGLAAGLVPALKENSVGAGLVPALLANDTRTAAPAAAADEGRPPGPPLRGYPLIRAVTVDDNFEPQSLRSLDGGAILLDAPHPTLKGGTGCTIDWAKAREAARCTRVILAGGLTPENAGDAIRQVRPFAVDVASGVESSPGVKDASKLRAFFAAVRTADQEFSR